MVWTKTAHLSTKGQGDTRDLTDLVTDAIRDASVTAGLATVSVIGSSAAITTIEFEPGAVADFNELLERLAPRHGEYAHHLRWGDDNGSSHLRAALVGPSVSIPIVNSTLRLGTWQQIVLVECDTRPRRREVVIQLMGE
jgi:secondary thiamine-phosphate synthase enzyme